MSEILIHDDEARHSIGANNPPVPIFDELSALSAPLIANANLWLRERPEIIDEETAIKAAQFEDQLKAIVKKSEAARVSEKKPHDDAAAAVQQKWRGLMNPAETCLTLFKPRLDAYSRRKKAAIEKAEREAREEAERKRQQAAEAVRLADELAEQATKGELAGTSVDVVGAQIEAQEAVVASKAADKEVRTIASTPSNIQGFARARSVRTDWKAEVADYPKALKHFKEHPDVKAVIQSLANALARSPVSREMPVPGVRFFDANEV